MSGVEIWRDIPGFNGAYQASSLGRIKSMPRKQFKLSSGRGKEWMQGMTIRGGILKRMVDRRCDRAYVGLRLKGKKSRFLVYRLVAMAFIPNPENKGTVNHKNGNTLDDRACNHSRTVLGYKNFGQTNAVSKVTWEDVDDMRILMAFGGSTSVVGRAYGVSQTNASRIKRGVLWPEKERPKYVG